MDLEINSLNLSCLKFISQNNNTLKFNIGSQIFNIIIPSEKTGIFILDIPQIIPGFEFLQNINEYILDKKPNFTRLLRHIDRLYTTNKKNQEDFSDISNILVDNFELQEQKYKKLLESEIINSKSNLNIDADTDKAPKLYSGNTPGIIILHEFFDIRKKNRRNNNINLSLNNNNIYSWNIKFKNFSEKLNNQLDNLKSKYGYDYIEAEIQFHDKLYPGYPPFLKIIRPKLNNSLSHKITNMQMVQLEFWSPCRGMDHIISKLYQVLTKYADLDLDSESNNLNNPHGAYHQFELTLIKLASLVDLNNYTEPIDDMEYPRILNINKPDNIPKNIPKNNQPKKTYWKPGTGYGTDYSTTWNIDEFLKIQHERDLQIQRVLKNITNNFQAIKPEELKTIYKILESSYLIPFLKSQLSGTNLLEIGKHLELYNIIFSFLSLIIQEDSVFLFDIKNSDKNLYEILLDLNKESVQVNKFNKTSSEDISNIIMGLFEILDPIYKKYLENQNKLLSENQANWNKKIQDNKNNLANINYKNYQEIMDKFKFDTAKFENHYYQNNKIKSTGESNPNIFKRLAREYGSLLNSLPIFYQSSIFARVSEQNNKCLKILITGPEGTPYDSGIFLFDIYTGDNYPNGPPMVKFINHGGKRFNPNLYADGKVCLSLLGTWAGSGGEQWNKDTSTLFQLFVSIQSQILVEYPYYNEPNYEREFGTERGNTNSKNYNNCIRYYTMAHAIYDLISEIKLPDIYSGFEDLIKNHFMLKKSHILKICQDWVTESFGDYKIPTENIFEKIKKILSNI